LPWQETARFIPKRIEESARCGKKLNRAVCWILSGKTAASETHRNQNGLLPENFRV